MDTANRNLTDAHIKVYKYIRNYLFENDELSPSYREIAEACEISVSYCHKLVDELRELGYVKAKSKKCRSIRI